MDRRAFITVIGGSVLAAPLTSETQQAAKVWRIGSVLVGTPETVGHLDRAIETSLAKVGYVSGRNISLMQQIAPPQPARVEEVLRAIIPAIDLLIVGSTIGGVVAKKITTTLPTVFLSVGDPVRIGLVSSLRHPVGNMTGVTFESAEETYGKRLQLLKEILPSLTTVGVLRTLGDANIINAMESLERAAPVLRVLLRPFDIKTRDDLDTTFAAMKTSGVQALVVVAGGLTYAFGRRISELALRYRLPSCHAFTDVVVVGGLISLGPDLVLVVGQAGDYVDKIIRGANPGDLPVQQPARYEMAINLATAKALGLTIPHPPRSIPESATSSRPDRRITHAQPTRPTPPGGGPFSAPYGQGTSRACLAGDLGAVLA